VDELTAGLDPESRQIMRKILKDLANNGKTIFFSSHDLEEVQKTCSHIGLINKGNLIVNVSLDELIDNFKTSEQFSFEKTYLKMVRNDNDEYST
jgi:ABC-2 type transport system ATP-binding protein